MGNRRKRRTNRAMWRSAIPRRGEVADCLQGRSHAWSSAHADKNRTGFCITRCVTRMGKNGLTADYSGGTRQAFNAFESSDLHTSDEMSEVVQKSRFAFRKPPFYPLNYANSDICDFRFSIADCKLGTSPGCSNQINKGL